MSPYDFICDFYLTLMQAGHGMDSIDKWDFFFYLDCLIYESKKQNKKSVEEYDNNGF